jgi:plasmid replication initiation protein
MPNPATTAELIELVRPFVGAKVNRQRDERGYILPLTAAVDILHRCNSVNADVREVTAEGIEKVWDGQAEFIRWSEVQSITIRSLDADGNTTAATTYEHDRLLPLAKGQRAFERSGLGRELAA